MELQRGSSASSCNLDIPDPYPCTSLGRRPRSLDPRGGRGLQRGGGKWPRGCGRRCREAAQPQASPSLPAVGGAIPHSGAPCMAEPLGWGVGSEWKPLSSPLFRKFPWSPHTPCVSGVCVGRVPGRRHQEWSRPTALCEPAASGKFGTAQTGSHQGSG